MKSIINQDLRIAFVSASWHREIVQVAVSSCAEELQRSGIDTDRSINRIEVPGSLEIPLVALKLAKSGNYQAIIAFGLVVDGGIYQHEFVANAVIGGLVRASLDSGVPILSAVLTPQQFHEHQTHAEFFKGHFVIKGKEAATAALEIIKVHQALPDRKSGGCCN